MNTRITPIAREVRVVTEAKSVADQICDLPIGSVILIEASGLTCNSTALHRTGVDGWLSTRPLPGVTTKGASVTYYATVSVRKAIDFYTTNGAEFTLVDQTID